MTPQQQAAPRRPDSATITQKVQLTLKLWMLEIARSALDRELLHLTSAAYEDVHGFLSSSLPSAGVFGHLVQALEAKHQAIAELTGSLQHLAEPRVCVQLSVKNGARANRLQPLGDKRILPTAVPKLGPSAQSSLMACSVARAAQLKGPLAPRPAAGRQDVVLGGISSRRHGAAPGSSPHSPAEEKAHCVICEEERPSAAEILPPAIIERRETHPERPPIRPPPVQALFPETRSPQPMEISPLMSWGREEDVRLQRQKQTSSQLLHFLRAKAKHTGALEVTERRRSVCSLPPEPRLKPQSARRGDPVSASCAPGGNQVPVFRVKRVEASGSLSYTCVIATNTELWDFGDVFTEAGRWKSAARPAGNTDCPSSWAQEDSRLNIQRETQSLQRAEPEAAPRTRRVAVPEFRVRRFEEAEVVVSHIVSPGNFYIQHADCSAALRALFPHSWSASRSYGEQSCIPDIGTKVLGWFPQQEQWCRAQVTQICGVSGDHNAADGAGGGTSIKVEVKKLDYGDTACLSLWNITELSPEMAALPQQAVGVSLVHVTPVNGSDWSEEAVGWFRAMVHNRTLYARLHPQGPRAAVELFLEKGKLGAMRRGASVSLRLAQNGHAKHNKLKNAGIMKISSSQLKMKKQESEWEKYLISCYTSKK